ncbi:MAG: hypothetical protein NTW07_11270, partial [candidate division Zixibacteria bacterium]|nr:hypothetical protein [candidate division Zixibacteria bacterium]
TPVLVSFSGYDIDGVVDVSPDTISQVYSNTTTSATVQVINRGDQVASTLPDLRVFFFSSSNSTEVTFPPSANSEISNLTIELPTTGLLTGPDTLCLVLQSAYLSDGQTVTVTDSLLLPVLISAAQGLHFVSSSVAPDSVYTGIPFDLAFRMAAGSVSMPWDSTQYQFELLSATDSLIAVAFNGAVAPVSFADDTLTYGNIATQLSDSVLPGIYQSQASFALFMGGFVLRPLAVYVGEFVVLPKSTLTYQTGTLNPTAVTSGQEWSFQFDLTLEGERPVSILPGACFLTLTGADASLEAAFPATGLTLNPGVNHITSKRVFIPLELLGLSLNPTATATYFHPGAANYLTFMSNFAGETISVEALPLIQIVETYVDAHNAPLVNTGQLFHVKCRVANLTRTTMTSFDLRLLTDGFSEFDPIVTVDSIAGDSTVEVTFDVVAAGVPNPAEIFHVDIATPGVNRLPPIDNIALVTVQRQAEISVSVIVRGADQGYLNAGDGFDILLGLVNTGEAQATSGRFRINTNGLDLGFPDGATIVEELVSVGSVRGLSLTAPPFDTVIQIDIDLIQSPVDANTGLPAVVGDTAFQVVLTVTSPDVRLHVEASYVPSNIVLPDEPRDLLFFKMFNPGESSTSNIRLKSLGLDVLGIDRVPLQVRSVIEVGSTGLDTGLYSERQRVATATAGNSRLTLLFQDYVVPAGDTVELALRTLILARDGTEFTLHMETTDIVAEFASGPLQGQAVAVATSAGSGVVADEVFTLVERTLTGSFTVRNNPWDLSQEQAEFMYYLSQADNVTFVVFTLTGEEAYRTEFRSGEDGGRAGENTVFWDGRSGDGSFVVNGVYVVVVSVGSGREQATLKLAVMR